MKREEGEKYKPQITVYDRFTLLSNEKEVYHAIFKETILKNRRCAQLSLSDLVKMTGLGELPLIINLRN